MPGEPEREISMYLPVILVDGSACRETLKKLAPESSVIDPQQLRHDLAGASVVLSSDEG